MRIALILAILGSGCASPAARPASLAAPRTPMTVQEYFKLDGPAPTAHLPYGTAPSQYVELFEPTGAGPFPVVVLIHGGCWTAELGGIVEMRGIAGALQRDGIAVWNVEYRRVDEDGGGYPGTYEDVNAALATLAAQAPAHHLDVTHIVAVGHSAGGHLVQWLAGRGRVPKGSPLFQADGLVVREIIGLGSLGALRDQTDRIKDVCELDLAKLTGTADDHRQDPFEDTDAAALMPNGAHTVLINGEKDTISPPSVAQAYAARARSQGDNVETMVLPGASHFDEVAVTSASWALVGPAIERAARGR